MRTERQTPGLYDVTLYEPDGERAPAIKTGDAVVHYVMAGGHLVDARAEIDSHEYGFVQVVDDHTALLRSSNLAAKQYGAVVTVHIDPDRDRASITTVTKASAADVAGVALAPDHEHVLLSSNNQWFVKEYDPSGEPQHRLRTDPYALTFMLGWYE